MSHQEPISCAFTHEGTQGVLVCHFQITIALRFAIQNCYSFITYTKEGKYVKSKIIRLLHIPRKENM